MRTVISTLFIAALCFCSEISSAQSKPFPRSLTYPGCIKPEVSQTVLNEDVSKYYNYWKSRYLRNDLTSLPGGYYVRGENTGNAEGFKPLGSSEGMGYGMIITVLMAGYDPAAKICFDGLFKTLRVFKSKKNPNLTGWVIADSAAAQGYFDSATDGDMDAAYSLLLAHYQWGSEGSINYLEEAKKMITDGILKSNVSLGKRLNLGDWDNKNSTNTRPSDWMMSHMRAFYKETNDKTWVEVIDTLYAVYNSFSQNYSPLTGLVSDFIINNPPVPCLANFLDEYPETNTFSYNACRFPLRIVMDYAHYGSDNAFKISNKLVAWIRQKTTDNPGNIKNGYNLDGSGTKNRTEAVFIAPFVAASVVGKENQVFLNKGWEIIKNKRSGYYNDSFNMLSMLFISGNWWKPENNSP